VQIRTEEITGTQDDIVLVVTCDCGNERMQNECDQHVSEKIYIYRHGVYPKSFLCAQPEEFLLKELAAGRKQCFQRYIVTLHKPMGESPCVEVRHVSSKRGDAENIVEIKCVLFPKYVIKKPGPIYPPSVYVGNPYKKE